VSQPRKHARKLLFICSRNRIRSLTAAKLLEGAGKLVRLDVPLFQAALHPKRTKASWRVSN
jgi:hypothetical protein